MPPLLQYVRLALLLLSSDLVVCLNVSISTIAPPATFSISPSFLSLSIEQDRWTDWVGNTTRNEFFFNTLDNLNGITGEPPHIRVGADSEDHTDFSNDVEVCIHSYMNKVKFPNPHFLVCRGHISRHYLHSSIPRSNQHYCRGRVL